MGETKHAKLIAVSALTTAFPFALHSVPALSAIAPLRKRLFKKLAGFSDSNRIALTFDDGPDPKSTPQFLDRLDKFGWKATFFMLGSMAEQYPELTQEVATRGHEIALHGYQHKNLLWRTPASTKNDIENGFQIISEICGNPPKFFRPPYGVLNTQALITSQSLNLTPILWSAWGRDWRAKATPHSVIKDLASGLSSGNTLLLHDSDCTSAIDAYKSALGSLDLLADELSSKNIGVERLCDHF